MQDVMRCDPAAVEINRVVRDEIKKILVEQANLGGELWQRYALTQDWTMYNRSMNEMNEATRRKIRFLFQKTGIEFSCDEYSMAIEIADGRRNAVLEQV